MDSCGRPLSGRLHASQHLSAILEIEKEIARRVGTRSGKTVPTSGSGTTVAVSARACPACSKDNDVDAQFCKHCGTTIAVSALACPACSEDNDVDARFCKHCGANMETTQ